jgi:adenylate cyclase
LWLPVVYASLALALTWVAITVYRFLTEERQRLFTKRAFQQYVSPELVDRIVEDPAALRFGGEVRELTVLFSDIRDFTTFAEKHDPQEVVRMLREHLTRMTAEVLAQQGMLDKYIGDAVMALFGAPVALADHAERACRAALAMSAEAERLRARWVAEGREPFRIGIGINTGRMVVGNLGSEQLRLHGDRRRGEPRGAARIAQQGVRDLHAHHHRRGHLRGGEGRDRGAPAG